jgi:multicomponent Na+:H+ antiporter subunit F
MIGVDIGIVILALTCITTAHRILAGPTDADRAVAGDLLFFGSVALVALIGVRLQNAFTFDIVLVAAFVGFLSALSLARAITRGRR